MDENETGIFGDHLKAMFVLPDIILRLCSLILFNGLMELSDNFL